VGPTRVSQTGLGDEVAVSGRVRGVRGNRAKPECFVQQDARRRQTRSGQRADPRASSATLRRASAKALAVAHQRPGVRENSTPSATGWARCRRVYPGNRMFYPVSARPPARPARRGPSALAIAPSVTGGDRSPPGRYAAARVQLAGYGTPPPYSSRSTRVWTSSSGPHAHHRRAVPPRGRGLEQLVLLVGGEHPDPAEAGTQAARRRPARAVATGRCDSARPALTSGPRLKRHPTSGAPGRRGGAAAGGRGPAGPWVCAASVRRRADFLLAARRLKAGPIRIEGRRR